jgi:hypothetical protein
MRGSWHHENGQRAFETNRRRSGMELSSPTMYLVRIAQTTGEYFRRGQRDCVESTTPAAQALHETGGSRQGQEKDHRSSRVLDYNEGQQILGATAGRESQVWSKLEAMNFNTLNG